MSASSPSAQRARHGRNKQDATAAARPQAPKPAGPLSTFWPATKAGRSVLGAILTVALLLRMHALLDLFPILVDESIYLRWAEIIAHQGQWMISLLDGKPPLHSWLLALSRMIAGNDPLLSGRALSVLVGLLSTLGIFAIGRRLSGETAGLVASGLYALFPLAVLYDRLAYTESLVNLCGIAIVLTSLECLGKENGSWRRDLPAAVALALGLFTKQTVLLFAFFPALAGVWLARAEGRKLFARLALVYAFGLLSLAAAWILTPEAPTLGTHSAVLHHTGFYVQPHEFLAHPFAAASKNLQLLGQYVSRYMTVALAMISLAALAYLTARRRWPAWLVLSVSVPPLAIQVFILSLMFPSRWAFPHFWPWLVVTGMAASDLWEHRVRRIENAGRRKAITAAALLLLAAPVALRCVALLASPRDKLHPDDATGFLGSSAHAGFGIREAVEYLQTESAKGPFVLLVDPIWGPPADAFAALLNQRYGIQVYEAWWTQLSGTHAIMPDGTADILKSHYERTKAGQIDFRQVSRVYYATDTNYYTDAAVKIRQPSAQLLRSFPKPGGQHSINVYRLK
jgi:hypothetical protein